MAAGVLCAAISFASPGLPRAAEVGSDVMGLAKSRYQTGEWLYEHGRYAEALIEFEGARSVAPLPELDYNVGRCLERLGREAEAIAAYRRYVEARPHDPRNDEVRRRILELEPRQARGEATAPAPRSRHTRLSLGLGVGGIGLALVGAATGAVVLARRADEARYDENRRLAISTDVLLPVGATMAAVGLVLYLTGRSRQAAR